MKHLSKISKKAFVAAAGMMLSGQVFALGLGDVEVQSYLNQPLVARIDLLSDADDDLSAITAKLASAADYELIGASMESVSVPIRFTIEEVDGDAYILATSELPLNSPIVRLIVEVDWSSGRMLREYTLFLDPASIASTAPAPRVSTPQPDRTVSTQGQTTPPPSQPVADTQSTVESEPEPSRPDPASLASGQEYGPVQSGETLWGIATQWSRGSGLDVNKVMLAIQRENPQAFMRNNMNLLKRGAILRMPEVSEVRDISTAAAIAEVSSQTAEFQQGSSQTSSEGTVTSATTPLLAEDSQGDLDNLADSEPETVADTGEPDLDLSLERDEAADAADARDQLELVPPSEASELDSVYGFEENPEGAELTASGNVTSLRENLARTEEELINEQQQNEYLQQQIEELEQRLADQEQSATANAAELAAMEQRLRTEREQAESESWFSGLAGWLVAIAVAIAALVGWLLSRRGRAEAQAEMASSEEALRDIQDEAEEVLKVLDEEKAEAAAETEAADDSPADGDVDAETEAQPKADIEADTDAEPVDEGDIPAEATPAVAAKRVASSDEAEFLDEESSDPEIQLDLARAYISMGDKEAARVILDEVLAHGNEEQKADAQAMKDQL